MIGMRGLTRGDRQRVVILLCSAIALFDTVIVWVALCRVEKVLSDVRDSIKSCSSDVMYYPSAIFSAYHLWLGPV
jgi:hypothetical protein